MRQRGNNKCTREADGGSAVAGMADGHRNHRRLNAREIACAASKRHRPSLRRRNRHCFMAVKPKWKGKGNHLVSALLASREGALILAVSLRSWLSYMGGERKYRPITLDRVNLLKLMCAAERRA